MKIYIFNMFQGSCNSLGRVVLSISAEMHLPLARIAGEQWYVKESCRGSLIFISTFHNNATLLDKGGLGLSKEIVGVCGGEVGGVHEYRRDGGQLIFRGENFQ